MRSNCLLWAVAEYTRQIGAWLRVGAPKGIEPHFITRPSRLAPWYVPHFQVERWDGTGWVREGFAPVDKSPLPWWQLWRVVRFVGTVERL